MSVLDVVGVRIRTLGTADPVRRSVRRTGALKRACDVGVAMVALITLAPLLIVLGIAVALTSRGPVFFRQTRIGVEGRPFEMLKFRTMCVDAEIRRAELECMNESDGPLFKLRHDPRVTGVGRWMRRYSLDELPQLLNVVNGTMSLVGPRPALPTEVTDFTLVERRREAVQPGLTGLAQVHGRSDLAWSETVRLDLEYVAYHSLLLDLRILVRTLPAVLGTRGAY